MAVGCSKAAPKAAPTSPTPTTVSLHGTLTDIAACSATDPVGNLQLTFRDQANRVIATVTTNASTSTPDAQYTIICHWSASYGVEAPKVAFYQVSVPTVSKQPDPISYADLAAEGFQYDLTITTSP